MHSLLKPALSVRLLLITLYGVALCAVLQPGCSRSLPWLAATAVIYTILNRVSRQSPRYSGAVVGSFPKPTLRLNTPLVSLFLITTCLLIATANPAYSFLNEAQTFISSCFSQASTLVGLVFNALRFIFLIYLGISLVQGINAIRDGQNLAAVAIPPIMVIVIVAAASFASSLIIGGASC